MVAMHGTRLDPISMTEVADFMGSHYSTVSRIVSAMDYARNKT